MLSMPQGLCVTIQKKHLCLLFPVLFRLREDLIKSETVEISTTEVINENQKTRSVRIILDIHTLALTCLKPAVHTHQ